MLHKLRHFYMNNSRNMYCTTFFSQKLFWFTLYMVFQLSLYMPFQFIVHVSKGAPLVSVDVEIGKI